MFLTENKNIYMPNIKEEDMDYERLVQGLDLENEKIYEGFLINGERKRVKLHHLTWEEKIQRKKLRNRIAAQTSRDRKKARMDHLEESVKDLKQKNELLFIQVEELKKKNELLLNVNTELQKALAQTSHTCSCLHKIKEETEVIPCSDKIKEQICVEDGPTSERPAESSEIPRQKGPWPTSAQVLTNSSTWKIWKIFLLYLLSQRCWVNSRKTHSWMTLKDWQQVCWKKLNSMRVEEIQYLYLKRTLEPGVRRAFLKLKWWGRHQKSWNPLGVKEFLP